MSFATAWGDLVPYSATKERAAASACSRSSAFQISASGLRAGLCGLGERVEDVGDLVEPAALLAGGGEDVTQRGPEPERSVADGEHWRSHAAALAVPEQVGPRLRRLAVPIGERRGL